jgi:hypothetical protein
MKIILSKVIAQLLLIENKHSSPCFTCARKIAKILSRHDHKKAQKATKNAEKRSKIEIDVPLK